MAIYHNYIAVIGRVHGHDEDSVELYEQCTIEKAHEYFRHDMLEDGMDTRELYINYVLTSSAPIVIEERNV